MKIDCSRPGIGKVGNRLPRSFRDVVSYPIDKIVQLAPTDLGVQNLSDLEFHMEGGRSSHDATREFVGDMWLQHADVEDRMDEHGRREVEMKGRSPDLANDGEGTESTNIQF